MQWSYTDPYALNYQLGVWLAQWAARQLAKLESAWHFETSAGGGGSVGAGKFVFVGAQGGGVQMTRGSEHVTLAYLMAGAGIGLSWPVPVSGAGSAPSFPSAGKMYILPGQHDFATSADFEARATGVVGPCAALVFDGMFVDVGESAGVMLLGASPVLEALLRRLARHSHELLDLMHEQRPPGFLAAVGDAITRPIRADVDLLEIAADIISIKSELESGTWARAALFFRGAEVGLSLSASVAAYFGAVHVTHRLLQ